MAKLKLSRKQIKLKEKLNLSMKYWFHHQLHVCWLTLTSSPESQDAGKDIWQSWKQMVLMFKREFSVQIEYCAIQTDEGYGVLHIFLVTDKRLPKVQKLISEKWLIYHLAHRVWINEMVDKGNEDAEKVTWYAVTQYASSGQGSHFIKAMWSRFSFLPIRPGDCLDIAQRGLRDICHAFDSWKITWRNRNPLAESILFGRVHSYNGYQLYYDAMCGKLDYLSSPFDHLDRSVYGKAK